MVRSKTARGIGWAVAVSALIVPVGLSGWWWLRPRPSLIGAAEKVATGRFQAAEAQLRAYLAAMPGDETATLLLAKVFVDRAEPEPDTALALIAQIGSGDTHLKAQAKGIEGDAHFWAGRYDRAESAWLEALELEPLIPEVGWKLLNVYGLQDRDADTRNLALRLFAVEPDERDRVQLLLQAIRHDAHSIEAGSAVHELEPIVRGHPADLRSSTALGLALLRVGRAEEGMALLRRSVQTRGGDLAVQVAYLEGLMATGGVDEMTSALEALPRPLAVLPRIDSARGWLASQGRDLEGAAMAYRRAFDGWPEGDSLAYSTLAYRFKAVLRQADRRAELEERDAQLERIAKFPIVALAFFDRINALPDLGVKSRPKIFEELAGALSKVGRKREAEAWASLARRYARPSP